MKLATRTTWLILALAGVLQGARAQTTEPDCPVERATSPSAIRPDTAGSSATGPFPEAEIGGHTAEIKALAYTADGQLLVSAGNDKTVRIWDIAQRKQLRVVRLQTGSGENGKIYALAASPRGRIAAVGGWLAGDCASNKGPQPCGRVLLVDLDRGEVLAPRKPQGEAALTGHGGPVTSLAFSPDGAWLASASYDGTVRLWDVKSCDATGCDAISAATSESIKKADGKAVKYRKVAFIPGRDEIAALSEDGTVRVFRFAGDGFKSSRALDRPPESRAMDHHALAVSADGHRIAAGGYDGKVCWWSWPDAGAPGCDDAASDREVGALAFRPGSDGAELAVTEESSPFRVMLTSLAKRSERVIDQFDDIVFNAVFAPDGSGLAVAGGKAREIRIWRTDAEKPTSTVLGGRGRSVYGVGFIVLDAPDPDPGAYLAWGTQDPCGQLPSCPGSPRAIRYALRLPDERSPTLGEPIDLAATNVADRTRREALSSAVERQSANVPLLSSRGARLEHKPEWCVSKARPADGHYPTLAVVSGNAGLTIAVRDGTRSQDHIVFTFDPTGERIASGGRNGVLSIYPRGGMANGQRFLDLVGLNGHVGDVEDVRFSRDGRLLVSGGNDELVKLWNAETGELVATMIFVPHRETDAAGNESAGEYVMWTPQGYYTASRNGGDLIGWRVNRGPDKQAGFATAWQLRRSLFNPELVARAIMLASAATAIDQFRKEGRLPDAPSRAELEPATPAVPRNADLTRSVEAVAEIKIVESVHAEAAGYADITFKVDEPPGGQPVVRTYALYLNNEKMPADPLPSKVAGGFTVRLPLRQGENRIVVKATSSSGPTLSSEAMTVRQESPTELDARSSGKGTLFLVAIGVNQYDHLPQEKWLHVAANDAYEFGWRMFELFKSKSSRAVIRFLDDRPEQFIGCWSQSQDWDLPGNYCRSEPTARNINEALKIFDGAKAGDTVVLYLSGHGTDRNKHGYAFLPKDSEKIAGSDIFHDDSIVSWLNLQDALGSSASQKLVFADTCQAAKAFTQRLIQESKSGVTFFAATSEDQDAYEPRGGIHGFFTQALLDGLLPVPEIIDLVRRMQPGKKFIDDDDLHYFVRNVVVRQRPKQEPSYAPAPGGKRVDLVAIPP